MARLDKTWMDIPDRCDSRYTDGVEHFLEFAFHDDRTIFRYGENKELIQCLCKKCCNTVKLTREEVKTHLIISGVWGHYRVWLSHGEEVVDIDQQMEEVNAEQMDQTEVQDNRAKLDITYRRGRTNMHQLKYDFHKDEGRNLDRLETFKFCHSRKYADGTEVWSDERSKEKMDQMTRLMNPTSEGYEATSPILTAEEAFIEVMGRDRVGRVRCGGRSEILKTWYGSNEEGSSGANSNVRAELELLKASFTQQQKQHQAEIQAMRAQMEEMNTLRAQMADMQAMRAQMESLQQIVATMGQPSHGGPQSGIQGEREDGEDGEGDDGEDEDDFVLD